MCVHTCMCEYVCMHLCALGSATSTHVSVCGCVYIGEMVLSTSIAKLVRSDCRTCMTSKPIHGSLYLTQVSVGPNVLGLLAVESALEGMYMPMSNTLQHVKTEMPGQRNVLP